MGHPDQSRQRGTEHHSQLQHEGMRVYHDHTHQQQGHMTYHSHPNQQQMFPFIHNDAEQQTQFMQFGQLNTGGPLAQPYLPADLMYAFNSPTIPSQAAFALQAIQGAQRKLTVLCNLPTVSFSGLTSFFFRLEHKPECRSAGSASPKVWDARCWTVPSTTWCSAST